MLATLPRPALTSVSAAAVESAAVVPELENKEAADKMMEGIVANALIPELMWSGASALFMSSRTCWMIVSIEGRSNSRWNC